MEKKIGKIPKGCVVHHINGCARDNRIKNLKVMSASDHVKLHHRLRTQFPNQSRCLVCGGDRRCVGFVKMLQVSDTPHSRFKAMAAIQGRKLLELLDEILMRETKGYEQVQLQNTKRPKQKGNK